MAAGGAQQAEVAGEAVPVGGVVYGGLGHVGLGHGGGGLGFGGEPTDDSVIFDHLHGDAGGKQADIAGQTQCAC